MARKKKKYRPVYRVGRRNHNQNGKEKKINKTEEEKK